MEHPFTQKTELDQASTEAVSGGVNRYKVDRKNLTEILKPVVKPPIGSTMAIGEEGGSFWSF